MEELVTLQEQQADSSRRSLLGGLTLVGTLVIKGKENNGAGVTDKSCAVVVAFPATPWGHAGIGRARDSSGR